MEVWKSALGLGGSLLGRVIWFSVLIEGRIFCRPVFWAVSIEVGLDQPDGSCRRAAVRLGVWLHLHSSGRCWIRVEHVSELFLCEAELGSGASDLVWGHLPCLLSITLIACICFLWLNVMMSLLLNSPKFLQAFNSLKSVAFFIPPITSLLC